MKSETTATSPVKMCRQCNGSVSERQPDSSGKIHWIAKCDDCARAWRKTYNAQYRATHKEQVRQHDRYRYNNNTERREAIRQQGIISRSKNRKRICERMKKWHQDHRMEMQQYNKNQREANIEIRRAYDRERYRNNPQRKTAMQSCNAKRRAHMRKSKQVEKIRWEFIIQRDNSTCYICSKQLSKRQVTFDHVIPLAKQGPHTEDNIKVACAKCNSWKGARSLDELGIGL